MMFTIRYPSFWIEAPILVDARLAKAPAFVLFLRAKRWMVEIPEQQQRLLVEGALDLLGCLGIVPLEVESAEKLHQAERLVFLRFNFVASRHDATNANDLPIKPFRLPCHFAQGTIHWWFGLHREKQHSGGGNSPAGKNSLNPGLHSRS
jgi:hypothetical protein